MGKLADAVAAEQVPKGIICTVTEILETLDKEDRAECEALLANPRVQHAALARAITAAYGMEISATTVGRHRKNGCRCGRPQ